MYQITRIQVQINEQAPGVGSLVAKILFIFCFVLYCQHFAFAQFMPNTAVVADSDLHAPIAVNPDDLKLKTEDGRVFATLQDYSAKLTILQGATVEIHRQGGFLNNIKWSKGKAKVNESFSMEGLAIVREITYLDGVPSVTNCTVDGISSDGMIKLNNSISIDLRDPKLAPLLKPYSGLSKGVYLTSFAFAVLLLGVIVWLVVRRYRQQHAQSNTLV